MEERCPAQLGRLICGWKPGHNADNGLHHDPRLNKTWAEEGSPVAELINDDPTIRANAEPRCPVQRGPMWCALLPGHSEEPPGKHHDATLGRFAVEGSPADDWLNLLAERSARFATVASVADSIRSTVRQ